MIDFFKKPYFYTPRDKVLSINLVISIFVFLFLFFFQPFGLNRIPSTFILLKVSLAYGLITFVVCLIFGILIPKLSPGFYNEDKWTIGKEIFHITTLILFIAIANYLYSVWADFIPFNLTSFAWMTASTLSIGGIIVVGVVAVEANQALKRNLAAAQNMSSKIEQTEVKAIQNKVVEKKILHLPSEVEKQSLNIELEKLIYLTSVANYIECYYLNESDKVVSSKIRNRMKVIDPLLDQYPFFFRCHRAFIINMNYVGSIDGNAKGYTLILKNADVNIPVARSKSSELKERLA